MGGWFLLHRLFLTVLLWVAVLAVQLGVGDGAGAAQAEVRNPDGVAVIIGNKTYTEGPGEVAYAHRDAEAFRRYVIDALGFDPRYVLVLNDASLQNMRSELGTPGYPGKLHSIVERRQLLDDHGAAVSDVVVFYSGHGMPSLKLEQPGVYLLPVDAHPNRPERDGYSVETLYEVLGALPARSVSVFLDACFTGVGGDGVPVVRGSPVAATSLPENVGENTVVFTAAEADQIAFWDDDAEHGMFTHHVLDALYGGGDRDRDGAVTVREVERYLQEYLWHAVLEKNGEQDAVLLDGTGTGARVLTAAADGAFPARPDIDNPDPVPVVGGPGDDGSDDPPPPALDLAAVTGGDAFLVVETTPPGASVLVGGAKVGETPLERYDLRAGTYAVTLDHPTHETVILENQTLADNQVLRVERSLTRATGKVTVRTRPSGGWVEHEGARLADSTPVTLDGLPSGPLVLTLGAADHHPARVEVEVPKGDVALVERALEKIRYGTLTLELEPSDARVTLADGDGPYRAGMRLAEREYRVRVTRAGYHEVSRALAVSGDTRERIALEPDPQPFTVVTTPADAAVRLPDRSEGYQPGMRLMPGAYRVKVSAEGWEALEATVRHGTAPTRHAVTLKRLRDPASDEAGLGLVKGDRVLIQQALGPLGFEPGPADGKFGQKTRAAVEAWQEAKGHESTGYLTRREADTLIAFGEAIQRREAWRSQQERAVEDSSEVARKLSDLLGRSFSAHAADENGWTDLHYAALLNLPEVVEALLSQGADVEARTADDDETFSDALIQRLRTLGQRIESWKRIGYPPLYLAAVKNAREAAAALIAGGADVNGVAGNGHAILHIASWNGAQEAAELLFTRRIDVDATLGTDDRTPLHLATKNGRLKMARFLLDRGADIQAKNDIGESPLHLAAQNNARDTAALLLDRGAYIQARDKHGNTPLHDAAWKNARDMAAWLVERGADITVKDNDGNTPLHDAAWSNARETAEWLVERGADITVKDNDGGTPLHDAAQGNARETAEWLVAQGADFGATDKHGRTLLHLAAMGDARGMAKWLVERGAKIDATDSNGNTPLHKAAWQNAWQTAAWLLEQGARVDAGDEDGETPLHRAAEHDARAVAELLLDHGADINAKANHGIVPLMKAGFFSSDETAELLITRGAMIDAKYTTPYGSTMLHTAASGNLVGLAQELVDRGADIDAIDRYGYTPLHNAASNNHLEAAEFLVAQGANVDGQNNWGSTPLLLVSRGEAGGPEMAQFLLDHGADPDLGTNPGDTPLMSAASSNDLEEVTRLVEQGANVNARNSEGKTALLRAVQANNVPIVEYLVEQGADPAVRLGSGLPLLHRAARENALDVAQRLVAHGADIHATNNDGNTPLHRAARWNAREVAEWLVEQGADVNAENHAGNTPLDEVLASSRGSAVDRVGMRDVLKRLGGVCARRC